MNQGAVLNQEDWRTDKSVYILPFLPLDRPYRLKIEAPIRRFTQLGDLGCPTELGLAECAKVG